MDCGLLLWLRLVDLDGFVGFNLVVVFCVLCFLFGWFGSFWFTNVGFVGSYLSSCSFGCFVLFGFVRFGYGVLDTLCCLGDLPWVYLRCLRAYMTIKTGLYGCLLPVSEFTGNVSCVLMGCVY